MAVSAACSNDLDACLKMSMDEGLIEGPRLLACSPHLETTGNERPHWWYDSRNTGMQVFIDGPEEMRKAVRTQIRRGADWIKILPTGGHGITEPHFRRLSNDEMRRGGRDRARPRQARPRPRRVARADRRVRGGGRRPDRPRRRDRRADHRGDARARHVLGAEHARPRRRARHVRRRRGPRRRTRPRDDARGPRRVGQPRQDGADRQRGRPSGSCPATTTASRSCRTCPASGRPSSRPT